MTIVVFATRTLEPIVHLLKHNGLDDIAKCFCNRGTIYARALTKRIGGGIVTTVLHMASYLEECIPMTHSVTSKAGDESVNHKRPLSGPSALKTWGRARDRSGYQLIVLIGTLRPGPLRGSTFSPRQRILTRSSMRFAPRLT